MGDRTPKDYAIEFGNYLATGAERFIAAVNSLDCARDGDSEDTIEEAEAMLSEAYGRLTSDIYEFRKRADRAAKEAANG